jgi:hypothetical protein
MSSHPVLFARTCGILTNCGYRFGGYHRLRSSRARTRRPTSRRRAAGGAGRSTPLTCAPPWPRWTTAQERGGAPRPAFAARRHREPQRGKGGSGPGHPSSRSKKLDGLLLGTSADTAPVEGSMATCRHGVSLSTIGCLASG